MSVIDKRLWNGQMIPRLLQYDVEDCFREYKEIPQWAEIFWTDISVSALGIRTCNGMHYWYDIEDWFLVHYGDDNDIIKKMRSLTVFNGQVKNFLVAATLINECEDGSAVAILGSRASAMSGNWIVQLMAWMEKIGKQNFVIIAYDHHEVEKVLKKGTNTIITVKRPYAGTGHEFDGVVDDIFLAGQSGKKWESKLFIQKDQSAYCVPFVHEREGRTFNYELKKVNGITCPCRRCKIENCIPGILPFSDMVSPSICRSILNEHVSMSREIPMSLNQEEWKELESAYDDLVYILKENLMPQIFQESRETVKYEWKRLPAFVPVVRSIDLAEVPIRSFDVKKLRGQTYSTSRFLIDPDYKDDMDCYDWVMTKKKDLRYHREEENGEWVLYYTRAVAKKNFDKADLESTESWKMLKETFSNLLTDFAHVSRDGIYLLKDADSSPVNPQTIQGKNRVIRYVSRLGLKISKEFDVSYKLKEEYRGRDGFPLFTSKEDQDYYFKVFVRKKNN